MSRAAFVVNPSKIDDLDALRAEVNGVLSASGWRPPLWLETTEEDPGAGMTRQALGEGVDVVVACGGDGTVAACAGALADQDTPLAVLPAGTGNLLARNVDIPTDLRKALAVVIDGQDRRIDLGCADEQEFVVMVGVGFDAAMLADTSEQAKSRFGWMAYAASGLRHLRRTRFRVTLQVDDQPPVQRRARAVLVANLGTLTAGLELLPEARPDDGKLDVAVISPRGITGWLGLAWHVIRKARHDDPGRIERFRVSRIRVELAREQPAELDGDPVGPRRELDVRVRAGALRVRVPAA
jgi:YegS/Rv2252/BmrU family lipid kinase